MFIAKYTAVRIAIMRYTETRPTLPHRFAQFLRMLAAYSEVDVTAIRLMSEKNEIRSEFFQYGPGGTHGRTVSRIHRNAPTLQRTGRQNLARCLNIVGLRVELIELRWLARLRRFDRQKLFDGKLLRIGKLDAMLPKKFDAVVLRRIV